MKFILLVLFSMTLRCCVQKACDEQVEMEQIKMNKFIGFQRPNMGKRLDKESGSKMTEKPTQEKTYTQKTLGLSQQSVFLRRRAWAW